MLARWHTTPGIARPVSGDHHGHLLALDAALQHLEAEVPVKARPVKLRYFVGTSLDETAQLLAISPATARRYWVYARTWLDDKLESG